jgi:hypothetical protein
MIDHDVAIREHDAIIEECDAIIRDEDIFCAKILLKNLVRLILEKIQLVEFLFKIKDTMLDIYEHTKFSSVNISNAFMLQNIYYGLSKWDLLKNAFCQHSVPFSAKKREFTVIV